MPSREPIAEIVDTLEDKTQGDHIRLADILDEFGAAAFSSAILAVSLLLVSPLSGVPLFSSLCGLFIFWIAGQGALGRPTIWLPSRIAGLKITAPRSQRAIERIRTISRWLDTRFRPRLTVLVSRPGSRVQYGVCALSGLFVPTLEFIPFTSSLVGLSVSLIAAGLLARDGLIALIGLLILPVSISLVFAAVLAVV